MSDISYSLVTVTLNSGKSVGRTIDSVLSQSTLPLEYIFIDGGSQDNTLDIINSKQIGDRGIKFILEPQRLKNGIYGAINQGINAASGDIIFIVHSDDWLEPEAAREVLAKFAEEPDCQIVLCPAFMHTTGGQKYLKDKRSFSLFPFLMPVIHPATFVRRNAYEKYGAYDEKYRISSDYDFFYRLHNAGAIFCEIRRPLVNVQLGGYANTHREKARKETLEIGLRHCRTTLLPVIAYLARKTLGR